MRYSTKLAAALALILAAVTVATDGVNEEPPTDAAALPFATTPGNESPVRATKGDRLDAHPDIRKIAGVTFVLRDIGAIVR